MSENNIILFGKYQGLSFKQILEKDINYCEFVNRCNPNDKTKEFKMYLNENLENQKIKNKQDKIKKLLNNETEIKKV